MQEDPCIGSRARLGVGCFPTYALGHVYAAQFFESAQKELGDLSAQFVRGEFAPLLQWLKKNIHRRGRQSPPTELVRIVTGEPLSHKPLMTHLHGKYHALYNLCIISSQKLNWGNPD